MGACHPWHLAHTSSEKVTTMPPHLNSGGDRHQWHHQIETLQRLSPEIPRILKKPY